MSALTFLHLMKIAYCAIALPISVHRNRIRMTFKFYMNPFGWIAIYRRKFSDFCSIFFTIWSTDRLSQSEVFASTAKASSALFMCSFHHSDIGNRHNDSLNPFALVPQVIYLRKCVSYCRFFVVFLALRTRWLKKSGIENPFEQCNDCQTQI